MSYLQNLTVYATWTPKWTLFTTCLVSICKNFPMSFFQECESFVRLHYWLHQRFKVHFQAGQQNRNIDSHIISNIVIHEVLVSAVEPMVSLHCLDINLDTWARSKMQKYESHWKGIGSFFIWLLDEALDLQ